MLVATTSAPQLTNQIATDEEWFTISLRPPSQGQKRLAAGTVFSLLLVSLITLGPLSNVQVPRIDAYLIVHLTALLVSDVITAVLLYAQFSILKSTALLIVASGYFFMSCLVIASILSLPGIIAPSSLIGNGVHTLSYVYVLWRAGFPLFIIVYALIKDLDNTKRRPVAASGLMILLSMVTVAAIVTAGTCLIITGDRLLPYLDTDTIHYTVAKNYAAGLIVLCGVLALLALWIRRRSILDLWLMVIVCANIAEILLVSAPNSTRFSLGWYIGHAFFLLSSNLVLFVLLYDITHLYGRLVHAVFAERREREARLMTGDAIAAAIAHEVKQPLTGMITNAQAGFRWLDRSTPDFVEAKSAFEEIVEVGGRTSALIESIRASFRRGDVKATSFEVDELVKGVLLLARDDLLRHRVVLRAEGEPQLYRVCGDRIALQQVLLNLIRNAIDSMAIGDELRILDIRSTRQGNGSIIISVADTGCGINEHDKTRIFRPLFTTKPGGMGMGLSISRSIVEAHGGRIWITPNDPKGTVFQFSLPVAEIDDHVGAKSSSPRQLSKSFADDDQ